MQNNIPPIKCNKASSKTKELLDGDFPATTIFDNNHQSSNTAGPPNLPPKRRGGGSFNIFKTRQRSESGESAVSVPSTVDGMKKQNFKRQNSSPAATPSGSVSHSPKLITDIIHQRLLPKDNCVTNILYARRLPSPPIFRRKFLPEIPKTKFARDDQFVETKTTTDHGGIASLTDQRQFCNNLYEEINKPKSAGNSSNSLLFCPLCLSNFSYSFGLECHLLSMHQDVLRVAQNETHFLQEMLLGRSEWCPCCQAQFLSPGLLVKHLLSLHHEYILKIIDPHPFTPDSHQQNMINPHHQHLQCYFCSQSFPMRHHKLLIQHIECKHVGELEALLLSQDSLRFREHSTKGGIETSALSLEVNLMLSLSKTVTFSYKSKSSENVQGKAADHSETDVPSIKRDRFGSLRSSLRRKKSNNNDVKNSCMGDERQQQKDIKAKEAEQGSFRGDKQFVRQNDAMFDFKKVDNNKKSFTRNGPKDITNTASNLIGKAVTDTLTKEGGIKRALRFSIPEVTQRHYDNGVGESEVRHRSRSHQRNNSQNIAMTSTKRERNSVDDTAAHCYTLGRSVLKQDTKRMRSLERPSAISDLNEGGMNDISSSHVAPVRHPTYHKPRNRMETTSHGQLNGTPHVNKGRRSQSAQGGRQCSLQFKEDDLQQTQPPPAPHAAHRYVPTTYRHIPQPEPPPPLSTIPTELVQMPAHT